MSLFSKTTIRLGALKTRIRMYVTSYGTGALLGKLVQRGFSIGGDLVLWILLLPFSVPMHVLGYRRVTVLTSRIGHLAVEVDSLLKEQAMNRLPRMKWLLLAPRGEVANDTLLGYWKLHLRVVENRPLCLMLRIMSRWLIMKHDVSHYLLKLNETAEVFGINARWRGLPLIAISTPDREWAVRQLQELGLPSGAWFVCVHVREAGYSPADEATHAHRNGSPNALIPALEEIAGRGGWCIRMGDPSMTKLPNLPNVIDYAHHPLRSPRLDIALCAMTRFFLGNSSGLALVSSVFGIPSALVNMVPLSALGLLPDDIVIHKLHARKSGSLYFRFTEIMSSPLANYRYARLYEESHIKLEENPPEDILDLVREMLDRLDGKYVADDDDEILQSKFKALLRPGHYSYGGACRIGSGYLRKYRHLI